MSTTMLPVVVNDLVVEYDGVRAVDSVSFHVAEGEVFGLLGPNGAGKTSVIRALTTIVEPHGGHATILDVPLSDPTAVRHHIGVLPESNGYPGSRSALRYLTFYGQLFGLTAVESQRRADDLLARFGLSAHRHRQIRTFSRGMRQRLGIARALINQPRVLFLDEPTIGLDPAGREDVLGHLVSVARRSETAVIICSHLLDDVERICDRVAIMHLGRLNAIGTVAELVSADEVGATVTVRVPADAVGAAIDALVAGFRCDPAPVPSRPGELRVEFSEPVDSLNAVAACLGSHGITMLGIDLRRTRLSDAFLAHTGASA